MRKTLALLIALAVILIPITALAAEWVVPIKSDTDGNGVIDDKDTGDHGKIHVTDGRDEQDGQDSAGGYWAEATKPENPPEGADNYWDIKHNIEDNPVLRGSDENGNPVNKEYPTEIENTEVIWNDKTPGDIYGDDMVTPIGENGTSSLQESGSSYYFDYDDTPPIVPPPPPPEPPEPPVDPVEPPVTPPVEPPVNPPGGLTVTDPDPSDDFTEPSPSDPANPPEPDPTTRDEIMEDVEKAINSGSDTVTITGANSIGADLMREATASGVTLNVENYSYQGLLSRVSITKELAASLQGNVNFAVNVNDTDTANDFSGIYANPASAFNFIYPGSFGIGLPAALKVDLTNLDVNNLVFYHVENGQYVPVELEYSVDAAGYLHAIIPQGGKYIVTSGELQPL